MQIMQKSLFTSSRSVYLLMYRANSRGPTDNAPQKQDETSTLDDPKHEHLDRKTFTPEIDAEEEAEEQQQQQQKEDLEYKMKTHQVTKNNETSSGDLMDEMQNEQKDQKEAKEEHKRNIVDDSDKTLSIWAGGEEDDAKYVEDEKSVRKTSIEENLSTNEDNTSSIITQENDEPGMLKQRLGIQTVNKLDENEATGLHVPEKTCCCCC
ncbi:histone-lysine N-methyltransferase SETD1B-like isoform X2 [Plectropomus leopardus]|uniref:histone-lysine N-methyltransferase SETD1B-like isoform X2 n=1 Tax=Plectropomus leopardus TaxID=160734 RepID=UPI001C4AD844|nr:histone-lysine N-methyltransferase SETD1B-like isoform X2 [Plectropomus leopardus]